MRAVLWLVQVLGRLPLPLLRALGYGLGLVLYAVVGRRRRVVATNLRLCFPHWSEAQRERTVREVFVHFAQSWLDRGWLWHGAPALLHRRLQLTGALHELDGSEPTVLFAPHFMGLDAAWTALTLQVQRQFCTIYTNQANAEADAWIKAGRLRFGHPGVFGRADGVKEIVSGLRKGQVLYLLPDMSFGLRDSLFVPFYGVATATVPSLSRFARLGRAKVVPVLARMTPGGYRIDVLPAWQGYPTEDLQADTATMNQRLQDYIDTMPAQYYWVHKRFKDRPPGEAAPY